MDKEHSKLDAGMTWASDTSLSIVLSYAALRVTLGTTFLFHGVTRFVSGWLAFADQLVKGFQGTLLPEFLVRPFALSVPPVEFVLGVLLILGLFTRGTLVAGGLWMLALVLGSTIKQDYAVVGVQLIYALLFFVLQVWIPANRISLDTLCCGRTLSRGELR